MVDRYILTGSGDPCKHRFFMGDQHLGYPGPLWEDFSFPAHSLDIVNPPVPPTWQTVATGTPPIRALRFARPSPDPNCAYFSLVVPRTVKDGSQLRMHLHWTPLLGGAAGNVAWKVDYVVAQIGDVIPSVAATLDFTDQAGATARVHKITDPVVVPGIIPNPYGLAVLMGTVWRDTDTWSSDEAYLLSLDFHVHVDKPGTISTVAP